MRQFWLVSGDVGLTRLSMQEVTEHVPQLLGNNLHGEGYARFKSSTDGRWIYSAANRGHLLAVAKMSSAPDSGVRSEATFLASKTSLPGVAIPKLIEFVDGPPTVLIVRAELGNATFDENVACRVAIALAKAGLTHGDFAPWNLLSRPGSSDPVLIDWESWRPEFVPYWDIAHYLYRKASLVQHAKPNIFVANIGESNGVIAKYESALGLSAGGWRSGFIRYLDDPINQPRRDRAASFRRKVRSSI